MQQPIVVYDSLASVSGIYLYSVLDYPAVCRMKLTRRDSDLPSPDERVLPKADADDELRLDRDVLAYINPSPPPRTPYLPFPHTTPIALPTLHFLPRSPCSLPSLCSPPSPLRAGRPL